MREFLRILKEQTKIISKSIIVLKIKTETISAISLNKNANVLVREKNHMYALFVKKIKDNIQTKKNKIYAIMLQKKC